MHRLDPRVKVLACLFLVMSSFAASGWLQLLPLLCSILMTFMLVPSLTGSAWRLCWMLRWLLLFTLLMHVFFSPGRTLWGVSWLSLDGFLMGSLVCVQMLLAVILSAFLAITTSTESLSGTFGWFVKPLQWLGFNTDEWQKILLLTMDFIPVVQAEIRVAANSGADASVEHPPQRARGRWALWMDKLQSLLSRLVDRGDKVAHQLAANGDSFTRPAELTPLLPMALADQIFSFAILLLIASYWLIG